MSEVVHRPPESVYNLLPKEEVHIEKPPRYMSKFRPMVIHENKSTKDAMKTLGPAKVELPSPEKYLKKGSKELKVPEKQQCSPEARHTCTVKKPAVPARTDNPPMGLHTKRDFVKTATTVPMKPRPTCVDSKNGHKQLLENSGLVPKYIKKKDYGEVPEYLLQRSEAQEEREEFVTERREQGGVKHLSDEERQDVLQRLKKVWAELHREYQGLPFVTDSLSKKARKHHLEMALKQLENDINLFERSKIIYVPN